MIGLITGLNPKLDDVLIVVVFYWATPVSWKNFYCSGVLIFMGYGLNRTLADDSYDLLNSSEWSLEFETNYWIFLAVYSSSNEL